MISGTAGFLIAVSAVSAGIFVLMMRAQNRRLDRARSRSNSPYYDSGGGGDGGDSFSFAHWIGFTDGGPNWDSGGSDSGADSGGSSDSGGGGGGD